MLDDGYKDQAVEMLGDHKPSGIYRGWKTQMYEGGTCVPFIVRWPAIVKPGVSEAMVCQMDLLASLAALTGQTYSERTDSQNTLAALLGFSSTGRKDLVVEGMLTYGLRQGDWLMIPPYPNRGKLQTYQLYNIKEDPGQKVNLAAEKPGILRQMMMRFEQLKRETGKVTDY